MFVALVLGMVSCQNYLDDFDVNIGGEKEVVVSVSLPEGTRANSAVGAISNDVVLSDEYTLRYIFQVWDEAKQQKKTAVMEYSDDTTISFPVRLVPGRNYRFVVWADVVRESDKTDLHYNTTNFPTISVNTDSWVAMDETRDAYTTSELITDFGSAQNYTLTLKRPFAKLRVITTDMNELMGVVPTTATVTYTTEYYNTFNALENKTVRDSKTESKTHENYTIKEYELTNGKVLFTDYFFAENDAVSFNLSVNMSDNGEPITRNFNTDIPVNRNHLTTLIGNILTEGDNIEVRIEEGFDGEIEYPIIDRTEPANNEIWYTSTDGSVVNPRSNTDFGANIISNTYYGGRGIITFDGDVTKIGEEAFYSSSKLVSIHIPEGVTAIKDSAFHHCRVLEDITLPQSLTEIGQSAFAICSKLKNITIPNSVTSIGNNAFYNSGITSAIIPEGVSSIDYYTFAYCENLENITIPDSVTSIGEAAFIFCKSLKYITIPDSVVSMGDSPFGGAGIVEFRGKGACDNGKCLIFDDTLYAFAIGCSATEYIVPDNVKSIKWATFAYSNLEHITLPQGLECIDLFAFSHMDSLTSITIPSNVTSIGECAFAYSENLENVYMHAHIPPVGPDDMFKYGSDNLKIYVPEQAIDAYKTAEGWSAYADKFVACPPRDEIWYTSINGNVINHRSGTAFGANIVSNTYENGRGIIKFDGEVTQIGKDAFWFEGALESIIIPNGVTVIDEAAFCQCDSLISINIPNSVITIGRLAFYDCDELTTVTIGDGVQNIDREAFQACVNLKTVTIGKNVKTIGWAAYKDCNALQSLYCKAVTPPTLEWIWLNDSTTIYVPAESYWDYVYADEWSKYKDNIVAYDFENNCIVATPAQTKPTRNEIWYTSLNEEVIEPYNTSAFGANIVSNTYENGKGVIKFDGEVTEIGDYAFGDSSYLSEIIIPSTVTNIGNTAFYNCTSLCRVDLWATTPPTMGWDTFFWCSNIVKIYVPIESLDAYLANDYWRSIGTAIFGR